MLGVGDDGIYGDHGLTSTNRHRTGLRLALAACWAGAELFKSGVVGRTGSRVGRVIATVCQPSMGSKSKARSICPKPDRRAWASGPQAGSPRRIRVARVATSECRSSVAGFE